MINPIIVTGISRSRRCRTHNRCCHGRRRARLPASAKSEQEEEAAAVARWRLVEWETCRSCRRHRRRCRPRCPLPIRRPNAAKFPDCRPARPNCVCSTRNTCRPSGTGSKPGWPNAGRSSCTAGGTVPWPRRTLALRFSDPICKQV